MVREGCNSNTALLHTDTLCALHCTTVQCRCIQRNKEAAKRNRAFDTHTKHKHKTQIVLCRRSALFAQNLLLLIGQSDETNRQKKKHFHLLHKIATPETRHSGLNVCYIFADFSGNKQKKTEQTRNPTRTCTQSIHSFASHAMCINGRLCVCVFNVCRHDRAGFAFPVLSCPVHCRARYLFLFFD